MLEQPTTDRLKQKWAFIYLGWGALTRTGQSNIEYGGWEGATQSDSTWVTSMASSISLSNILFGLGASAATMGCLAESQVSSR